MIDFSLDAHQQGIIEKHRDFSDRFIVPVRAKYDESCEFPWEVVRAAYDEGIINGPVPSEYGGPGHNILEGALASEELGAGCIGIGICIDANSLALTPLIVGGSEEQKKRVFGELIERKGVAAYALTEPNAGSDVANIKTTGLKKGDKYIINGHKRFITNGEVAAYHTVFALADPERGARSLTAFIVPTDAPGVEVISRMRKMGQNASVQNEIKYTDVEIPLENCIGGEGRGFILAMKTFDRTRTGVAALALGAGRTAYETSMAWAKNRIQFGKPITANQAIAFMLADMATELEAARLLTWRAAWAYDNGDRALNKLSAMSKMYASDVAMKVAIDAVQVMGGDGYSRDFPVEKIMRDVKLCQIYEGTNQVQRLVISKAILK
ncbi:MAG: acyl-CoA dehydrogenase [Bacteroidetes Order II. Incertae sedis bacterium]|jgi:acyl-CoA dehydrogenase|nr:acyl-CoA dehydrogenase [Bacteroidetes Order II. bacterium]MDG2015962.1 acyl-CoA dehydrogenase family protein [Rhodothermales bacterium]HAY36578.1 acyl-CoA dehydrogenase [Bacteroidota bacterium]MBT4603854.1 acyl-CoA dehydrogenase [Bacteroidetes Order II. bacterium]MBT5249850.1 acyl-CoA dehydrogenase [Bacteroidetes Order II. bacterium]